MLAAAAMPAGMSAGIAVAPAGATAAALSTCGLKYLTRLVITRVR